MSNQSISIDPDPESAKGLGILFVLYAILGIPANLVVLFLTLTTASVRAVPLNICIFSLAFADMMDLISFLSSMLWVLTYNEMVCKVMGVGIYVFIVMSLILPASLAVCRHSAICGLHELHPYLWPLKTRKGIFILNAILWTYGFTYPLPFAITDKFGLDAMGCCGIVEIDSVFLWVYYMIVIVGVLFGAYAVTFIFYRKLGRWVKETSSMIDLSAQTRETLAITRNVMCMIKWLLFFPVVVYYPALCCQALLRIFPNIVSVRTARLFLITSPLPHIFNPLVTIVFVKRYRLALRGLLLGRQHIASTIYATETGPAMNAGDILGMYVPPQELIPAGPSG